MNACTIIAWHHDGAVYCPDCRPTGATRHGDVPSPVFADSLDDEQGATCDTCLACLVGADWMASDDATGPMVRWACCTECNAQVPHRKGTRDYRRTRHDAMRGQLMCGCCARMTMHF